MDFNKVTGLFKGDLALVEEAIKSNYSSSVPLIPSASSWLMDGGGKRIRPLLLLLCHRACGGKSVERAIKHACSIEYIHAATLLHDDVIDETTLRRGHETVRSKWGSDASILVGDYLISQAILNIAYDTDQRIIQIVAEAAKVLVEGGIMEFSNARDLAITQEQYLDIIYRKTASLISVTCRLGAILAGAGPETEDAVTAYGEDIGIAFQLVDDVMDYDSTEDILGKPVGTDFKEGQITLPLLNLYNKAPSTLKREIESFIQNESLTRSEFEYTLDRMREYKAIEETLCLARNYIDRAKTRLKAASLGLPEYIGAFHALADNITERHSAHIINQT
tara:strand:- start:235 stop:1239 length:1005 start_codon:yes stop_codon:yes gene_type:complete